MPAIEISSIDRFMEKNNRTGIAKDAEEVCPQIETSRIQKVMSYAMKISKTATEGQNLPKNDTFINEIVDYDPDQNSLAQSQKQKAPAKEEQYDQIYATNKFIRVV